MKKMSWINSIYAILTGLMAFMALFAHYAFRLDKAYIAQTICSIAVLLISCGIAASLMVRGIACKEDKKFLRIFRIITASFFIVLVLLSLIAIKFSLFYAIGAEIYPLTLIAYICLIVQTILACKGKEGFANKALPFVLIGAIIFFYFIVLMDLRHQQEEMSLYSRMALAIAGVFLLFRGLFDFKALLPQSKNPNKILAFISAILILGLGLAWLGDWIISASDGRLFYLFLLGLGLFMSWYLQNGLGEKRASILRLIVGSLGMAVAVAAAIFMKQGALIFGIGSAVFLIALIILFFSEFSQKQGFMSKVFPLIIFALSIGVVVNLFLLGFNPGRTDISRSFLMQVIYWFFFVALIVKGVFNLIAFIKMGKNKDEKQEEDHQDDDDDEIIIPPLVE